MGKFDWACAAPIFVHCVQGNFGTKNFYSCKNQIVSHRIDILKRIRRIKASITNCLKSTHISKFNK